MKTLENEIKELGLIDGSTVIYNYQIKVRMLDEDIYVGDIEKAIKDETVLDCYEKKVLDISSVDECMIITINAQFDTLEALTGQESGIVVYDDAVIATNWMHSCPDGGLPRMAPANIGLIAWPDEIIVENKYTVNDIRAVLPGKIVEVDTDGEAVVIEAEGMDLVFDDNGDIPALWGYDLGLVCNAIINRDDAGNLAPTPGTVYELEDGVIVIAPDSWA